MQNSGIRKNRLTIFSGGQGGIRTPEGRASGFTVRPSWPLWYLPVILNTDSGVLH